MFVAVAVVVLVHDLFVLMHMDVFLQVRWGLAGLYKASPPKGNETRRVRQHRDRRKLVHQRTQSGPDETGNAQDERQQVHAHREDDPGAYRSQCLP